MLAIYQRWDTIFWIFKEQNGMSDPRRWIIFTAATGNRRGGEEKGAELLHLARRSTTQLLVFPCPITFLVEENKKKQRRNPCRTFAKNGTRKSWKNLTGYIHYSIPLFFLIILPFSSLSLSFSLAYRGRALKVDGTIVFKEIARK